MMEAKRRKTGSVRLNEDERAEMERLGIENESAYVRYKMNQGQSKLEVLKTLPATQEKMANDVVIEDKLTIQRLALENSQLQEKLEAMNRNSQETLNGVSHKVHTMLQEELQKRDFEALKKDHSQREKQLKKLEENLDEIKKENETKQTEIEALVKKLGFVELGKALLPGAISGLAKQYPNQMKGIAGTLGSLGVTDTAESNVDEEKNQLLQIATYLQELFNEEQFEQVIQLLAQMGDQIKEDDHLIQKIGYYMNQLRSKSIKNEDTD